MNNNIENSEFPSSNKSNEEYFQLKEEHIEISILRNQELPNFDAQRKDSGFIDWM